MNSDTNLDRQTENLNEDVDGQAGQRSASEERYRAFVEHSSEAIWRFEIAEPCPITLPAEDQIDWFYRHGYLAECNDAMARMYGLTHADDLLGMRLADVMPRSNPDNIVYITAFIQSGYRLVDGESQEKDRDGNTKYFLNNLVGTTEDGALVRAWGMQRDITARKRAEAALRESEERYRRLFNDDLTGDFISTPDGQLLDCNIAFTRMFGFASVEEALTCNLVSIYPDAQARAALMDRLRREKRLEYCEIELCRIDGTPVYAVENIIGTFDEHDTLVSLRGYIFDDTRRKELEDQLRQSQKLEAIGQLAGGVAHDFNNLLTAITGHSELCLRSLTPEDPLYSRIEQIKNAGNRAAALTRQLLAFSRKQILKPEVLDLNQTVVELNKMLQRLIGEDIDLYMGLSVDLGKIQADPNQLEQVLMNLCLNARDAMPKGGKLTIETSNAHLGEELASRYVSISAGPYVMLAVSDTGCGMDARTQARIFEPFFTTKEVGKGTGLGLATVYGIVKQSGGSIWVYSEVGRGTTFKIYLPRVDAPVERVEADVDHVDLTKGDETVLLAEDEDVVREMATEILRASGYHVLEAKDGDEALRMAEQYDGEIHLMLTDVVMPQMGGRELADQLTPLRRDMKVLYMSGYTDDAIVHHGVLEAGTAFIAKPFSVDALSRKVREVLDAPVAV
jgi:two-component system, cell cycle sensor histidine kinase and response regulator CckA